MDESTKHLISILIQQRNAALDALAQTQAQLSMTVAEKKESVEETVVHGTAGGPKRKMNHHASVK